MSSHLSHPLYQHDATCYPIHRHWSIPDRYHEACFEVMRVHPQRLFCYWEREEGVILRVLSPQGELYVEHILDPIGSYYIHGSFVHETLIITLTLLNSEDSQTHILPALTPILPTTHSIIHEGMGELLVASMQEMIHTDSHPSFRSYSSHTLIKEPS